MRLHVQPCACDGSSRASSPLAGLTLKLPGRFEAKRANTPLQGQQGLNILPAQAVEIRLQANEEWADLPSLLHLPARLPVAAEAHHGLELSGRAHATALTLTAGSVLLGLVIIRQERGPGGGAAGVRPARTPGVCMSEHPWARRWTQNCSVCTKVVHLEPHPLSYFYSSWVNPIAQAPFWNWNSPSHCPERRSWGALGKQNTASTCCLPCWLCVLLLNRRLHLD